MSFFKFLLSNETLEEAFPGFAEEGGRSFFSELMNTFSTLGLVVIALLVLAWLLKRFALSKMEQANVSSEIKVLERRTISPKTTIYLMEVEGTAILMAESVNGTEKLAQFELEKNSNTKSGE